MNDMNLESLKIEMNTYGEHKGKYTGIIRFKGSNGDLGVVLSPEITTSFLAIAGDLLIAHVEVAGKALLSSIDAAVDASKRIGRTPKEIAAAAHDLVEFIAARKT